VPNDPPASATWFTALRDDGVKPHELSTRPERQESAVRQGAITPGPWPLAALRVREGGSIHDD
jgi:hypothetical protein